MNVILFTYQAFLFKCPIRLFWFLSPRLLHFNFKILNHHNSCSFMTDSLRKPKVCSFLKSDKHIRLNKMDRREKVIGDKPEERKNLHAKT